MEGRVTHGNVLLWYGLITEVECEDVSIIGNTVTLKTITLLLVGDT